MDWTSPYGERAAGMVLPVISVGRFAMRRRSVPIPAISSRTGEISLDARLYTVVPFVVCSMSLTRRCQ